MKATEKKRKIKKKPIDKSKKQQVVVVAQEIKFARLLSGNEKKTRDRVLRALKKWLLSCFEKNYGTFDILKYVFGVILCDFFILFELKHNLKTILYIVYKHTLRLKNHCTNCGQSAIYTTRMLIPVMIYLRFIIIIDMLNSSTILYYYNNISWLHG